VIVKISSAMTQNKKRYVPVAIIFALLAGLIVSIVVTPSAQADYFTGCGYGYGSTASGFGSGTGNNFGYGYLSNGSFGYGYGNQVCPMSVTTTSLPNGTVGVVYSQVLTGTGGTGIYTWTVASGSLPLGLTLSSGGTISGTPNAASTSSFVAKITDANGQSASKPLSITTITKPSGAKQPSCIRIVGHVIAGRTRTVTITGRNFYGQPRITSTERHTRAIVSFDNGTVLRVVVQVRTNVGHGNMHTFTVRNANGLFCRVNYRQY
jgi:hypothetical protein